MHGKLKNPDFLNVTPEVFIFKPYPCGLGHQARRVTFPQQTANAFFLSAAS